MSENFWLNARDKFPFRKTLRLTSAPRETGGHKRWLDRQKPVMGWLINFIVGRYIGQDGGRAGEFRSRWRPNNERHGNMRT